MTTAPHDTTRPFRGLTLETARRLFDGLTLDGEPDFSIIETFYHPDVRFRDPIQHLEGRDAFLEMSRKLVERCKALNARVHDAARTGDVIFLQWTMEMKIGPAPLTAFEGVTRLRLDRDGRVVDHRDFFDLWGDSLGSAPGIGPLYRRLLGVIG